MKEKILVTLGAIMMGAAGLVAAPTPVMAAGGNCGAGNFLGMKPWFDGLCESNDKNSNIVTPSEQGSGITISTFVWTIVLNVLFDLMVAIGYLAVGFVIYGGYLYIMSQGDPSKAQKGKRTLMTAITGVIIAMGASVIVNTAVTILGINTADGATQQGFDAARVQSIFSWAYSMAGLVAVIFIIKSGIDYMLSQGDPGKTQKATRGIIYSIVGLVIVILAAIITSTVISSVGGAL